MDRANLFDAYRILLRAGADNISSPLVLAPLIGRVVSFTLANCNYLEVIMKAETGEKMQTKHIMESGEIPGGYSEIPFDHLRHYEIVNEGELNPAQIKARDLLVADEKRTLAGLANQLQNLSKDQL